VEDILSICCNSKICLRCACIERC